MLTDSGFLVTTFLKMTIAINTLTINLLQLFPDLNNKLL